MGTFSIWHILVVLIIALLLFGSGRVADVGKGLGEGIRNFKKGLKDEDEPPQKEIVVKEKAASEGEKAAPQLTAKKKIIQIEVDDDADEEEIKRKLATKTAEKSEKTA